MKKNWIIVMVFTLLMAPALAQATQFAIVGPRALGMGGASVAAVNDATAVYWNPAALADFKKFEIRIPAGIAIRDHIELQDKWDRINAIYDQIASPTPALLTELDQLLTDLDKPKSGTDIDAHVGLFVSIPAGRSAFAISALGLAYAGIYPTIDTLHRDTGVPPTVPLNSIALNNSAVTGVGLFSAEPGVTFATPIGEKFFVGANAKMMSVTTYVHSESIRTGDFDTFIDNLDLSETSSSEASIDAGILFKASENLRLGVVGRYLNSPSFPFQGIVASRVGGDVVLGMMPAPYDIEIEPQFRAGLAWKPFSAVTLSADYDLSKNKSLGIPGYEDQTIAGGIEIRLPKEFLSIRGGAYKNTAATDANVVYTAGLGLRIYFFRVDVAGAYDFDDKEGQVSANLAFRF